MRNLMDFSGRRLVITGGASGIGLATATQAARLGADVVIWDSKGSADAASALSAEGLKATGADCDVTDRAAIDRLAAMLGDVHAVVTCAGICPLDDWMAEGFDAVFDRTIDVNLKGSINAARAFFPGMSTRKDGRIVLVGSVSGRTASVSGIQYAASKGGVHSAVRWLARVGAAHGVLVNGVAPGPVETSMVAGREEELISRMPIGRLGTTGEIAWPILFLCSPMASFMTGSILDVNGGVFIG